jgi:DNA-binding NarL/FixJ family response regulator
MPVMSGEDFVAQAMAKFDSALPPVWVCTVDGDAATVRNLLAKGISGYLLKPVQLRAFATKLQGLFPDMELRIP